MDKISIKVALQLFVLINFVVFIKTQELPIKDSRCPENEGTNSPLVLLPHINDCRKYYYCAKGFRIPMNCPAGLVFNNMIKVCDWPNNVECDIPPSYSEEIYETIWRTHDD